VGNVRIFLTHKPEKLKGALGMFQFYKKFIPNYSTILIPLNRLLLQKATFRWTEVEQEAFDCLRDKLKNAPFMQYPNDTGVFTLETDASTKSIGYILYQSRPNDVDGIVACGGRSLRGTKFNYTVTELEMLSIIDALNKYRHFLLGRHFIIKSDHISLRFINSLKDSSTGRLFRWSLSIQGFDFELIYVKGSSHTVADSLSRRNYPECTDSTMDKLNEDRIVHTIVSDNNTVGDKGCLSALCEQVYDGAGNLTETISDLVIKRLSYLVLPGSSKEDITATKEGGIRLEDVCEWLNEDCGIVVGMADIHTTVISWMQNKVYIQDGMVYAGKIAQVKGIDFSLIAQSIDGKAVGKHGSVQNGLSAHARPDTATRVIGTSLGGGSGNQEVMPTKLNAVAAEFLPAATNSSRAEQFIAGMNRGHLATQGARGLEIGQSNKVTVEEGTLMEVRTNTAQATVREVQALNMAQNESRLERDFPRSKKAMNESAVTEEHNKCYLTDNMQTRVSKRMSYLLRHAASSEKVAMSLQGYVDI